MQSYYFGFEKHQGHWAVFSLALRRAERASRVIGSPTAESPTISSIKASLVSMQGFSPPVPCEQGRLVNERHTYEARAYESHVYESQVHKSHAHESHVHENHIHESHAFRRHAHNWHACKSHALKNHA
jgi:hypothetical protein